MRRRLFIKQANAAANHRGIYDFEVSLLPKRLHAETIKYRKGLFLYYQFKTNNTTMRKLKVLIAFLCILASCGKAPHVCVYGGASACVTAAYSAAHEGCEVTLICPEPTIGGMTTGGLGQTDIGNKQAVIGLARQFYRKLGDHYGKLEQWLFEPHVAEEILMEYLDNPKITVLTGYRLESVAKDGTRITSVTCLDKDGKPLTVKADQFIDCSYEGDLMAKAGVSYTVGREGNDVYGEKWNGSWLMNGHQFPDGVDPYIIPGKPESGLLWGISDQTIKPDGTGDNYVQAYNYRICLTDNPENMIPIEKPEGYDPSKYELLVRLFAAQPQKNNNISSYFIWSLMPNHKTDINNCGGFSTDMIGMNYSYPEASWEERDAILKAHKDYTLGLLYFYQTDPRVPPALQDFVKRWGLPKDEYPRTGHWTHQLYIREARRMIGEYVETQKDVEQEVVVDDGIGYAAYGMDSHNCERVVIEKDGRMMVKNEGNVEKHVPEPYPISYRALTPKKEECENLLVPVCLSASHIAYGSIRMEPVFLELGQVCGLAAAFAGPSGKVQAIDVKKIQDILRTDPYLNGREPDTLIDEDSPSITGKENWEVVYGGGSYGRTYLKYTGSPEDNRLEYKIPDTLDGEYSLYTFQQRNGCETTKFVIEADGETSEVVFNRSDLVFEGQTPSDWVSLGKVKLTKGQGGSVRFSTDSGELHADALLLVKER